jgi:acetolactate synthase-1/2/3 large subunit
MRVSEIALLLRKSNRPLIHVGQGIRGAEHEFFRLVEEWGIPFVTARNANDICASDHPLFVGRPGTFAQRGANFAVQTCDFYLAIGTSLSLTQTGYNNKDYARNAQIVQVDIDDAVLNKGTLRNPTKVCMDSKEFLTSLLEELPGNEGVVVWASWITRCQNWKEKYPVNLPEYATQPYVNSYHFVDVLSNLATPEDVIVTDMGMAFQCTHQGWKVKKGQRLMTNCGLAPMGWGLPAAVGASFATGRRVICITGDGGLMMNIQELATIMHHKLPIKIFVLNNGGYATIKQSQEIGFEGRLMGVNGDTGLSFPNFKHIAVAHSMFYLWIPTHDAFSNLAMILDVDRPTFCEIMMNPDQPQAPRSLNRRNPDGTMNPTNLEDASPFLPPEEVALNMRIA